MEPNSPEFQTYGDFLVTKYLPLDEIKSSLIELVHTPTGARVMHIANQDPENLFCLAFQTFPESSNGVAHILEHTVLCGSKKFPVKDPFFAMTRRSLNTYMNALTGQDFTCYPASSEVPKDFYNLLSVYLDAVFAPELKHLSFLQEGHRLDFHEGKLRFQGVVYNEMKGAMSSIDSRLWEALSKRLVPDLPYAHNSGGNPRNIPELSYEELKAFHANYYHPSRCLFFFYGNLPLEDHLKAITPYLGVEKIPLLPPLPRQERFTSPVFAEDRFPIAKEEDLKKKTQIVFSWLTVPISHQSEILALQLLESILTDTDASPLTKALLKTKKTSQVDSFLDVEMSEIPWAIVCKGCEAKDAEALQKTLLDTLLNLEISSEEVEAALHTLEFERTEINAEGGPFGLTLFMRAAPLKQHGSEPEHALLIHTLFHDLRERLKDPRYLNNLLQKYLIDNPHFVRLILKPDPKLSEEEDAYEKECLEGLEKTLTPHEKEVIKQRAKELLHYQEQQENQSLDCLPKVTLKDVSDSAVDFPLIEKGAILHHECFTNQIIYADLIYELPELTLEELPMLSLLAKLIMEIGCGGRSYEETLHFQSRYIGGIDATLALHVTQENPDVMRPTFSLRGKALYRNRDKLMQLFTEVSTSPNFKDKARIQEFLEQHATELEERMTNAAIAYAVQMSLSSLSLPSFVYNQWHGLPYYEFILKQVKHCDIDALEALAKKVLGVKNPHLILVSDKEAQVDLKLPNKEYKPWTGNYKLPEAKNHHRIIASPVAFTSFGMRTVSYKDPRSPYLLLAAELMKSTYLHKEVREKGGAYGAGASYTPSTGNFHFTAYRDPHLASTINAFHAAIDKIARGDFNERELEEAKLSVLQTLDAPVAPGNRAMVAYAWLRAHRPLPIRTAFRNALLAATPQDVASATTLLKSQTGTLSTFLPEELWKKEKDSTSA